MILDYFFKRPSYELHVSHYYRGQAPDNQAYPFHRAIFLRTTSGDESLKGTLYQLVPAGANFRYFQQANVELSLPDSFAGSVKIGTIRSADVPLVESIIQNVPILPEWSSWTVGQEWTRDAVRRVAKGGFVDLDLLAKLYPKLQEMEKDFLCCVVREELSSRDSVGHVIPFSQHVLMNICLGIAGTALTHTNDAFPG